MSRWAPVRSCSTSVPTRRSCSKEASTEGTERAAGAPAAGRRAAWRGQHPEAARPSGDVSAESAASPVLTRRPWAALRVWCVVTVRARSRVRCRCRPPIWPRRSSEGGGRCTATGAAAAAEGQSDRLHRHRRTESACSRDGRERRWTVREQWLWLVANEQRESRQSVQSKAGAQRGRGAECGGVAPSLTALASPPWVALRAHFAAK